MAAEEKKKKYYRELEDLPGIGEASAEKLRKAGYSDFKTIASSTPHELAEAADIGVEAAKKAIAASKEMIEIGFETADQVYERRKSIGKITTGSKSLDELLGGGVETQSITEAYGKFSSGKCIAKDTIVSYLNDEHFYLESIEETYNKYAAMYGDRQYEEGRIVEGAPISVYSLTDAGLSKEKATHIYKEKVARITNIKTKRGRQLSLTLPHRLLVMTNEGVTWKQAGELKAGDAIAHPRSVSISNESALMEDDAYFLGFFVAEGTANPFSIDTSDAIIKDWIVRYVSKRFGFEPTVEARIPEEEKRKVVYRILLRKQVAEVIKDLSKSNAANKYIPREIFTAPDEIKKSFLAGYVEGDGYLGSMIELTTKSKKLAEDLTYLNTMIGASASVTRKIDKKYGEYYRVFIGSGSREVFDDLPYKFKANKPSSQRTEHGYPKETIKLIRYIYASSLGGGRENKRKEFGEHAIRKESETVWCIITGTTKQRITDETMAKIIGLFKEGEDYLAELINGSELVGTDKQRQKEFIMRVPFAFNSLSEKIGLTKAAMENYLLRGIPENRVNEVLKVMKEELQRRLNNLRTGLEQLKIVSYFGWDLITKNEIADYNDFVYDFVVPNGHTFIGGNIPTLLHNSQLGFQLAINVQKPIDQGGLGGKVLFCDTEATFRPERVAQIAEAAGLNKEEALKNIFVARAEDSDHQALLIEKAGETIEKNNIKLVIIDSLTSHFRADYMGRGALGERQQKLNKHVHDLQKLAEKYNLAVYITNQVMDNPGILFGDPTQPIGGHVLAHMSTARLYFRKSKEEKRIARLVDSPNLPEGEAVFKVTITGITD